MILEGDSSCHRTGAHLTRSDRYPSQSSRPPFRRSERAQREAVGVSSGPLVILAGAGTGKTRVISRRAAHAIETGAVPAGKVLLVTFTDKAANEMVERMAALGHRGVMARTFHSHAVRQLRHFWPSHHDGQEPPQILELEAAADQPAGAQPARPLPLHADQGHRRRDRVGQGPPHRARQVGAGPADTGQGAHPSRPLRPHLRRLRARQAAPGQARLRGHARPDRRTPRNQTKTPPASCNPRRRGSASTSTRTRTRSRSACSSCGWATRPTSRSSAIPTRRSTPSPAPRPTTCSASPTSTPAPEPSP